MAPRDDWTMSALADQGAYRGPWPQEYGPPAPPDPWAPSMAGAKEVGRSLIDMARSAPGHAARGLMSGIASLGVPGDPIPFGDTSQEFDRGGLEGAQAARKQLEAATYEPQTMAGHYMGSLAEIMGNPLNWAGPGGAAAKAAWNVASGIGGETGAQAAKGTPYEGAARLAGSFGPMALERGWQATGPLVRAMPEGQVGIFGGRMAVTADQQALNRAESMAKAGKSRDDIWNDTGWFQGADGKWRFEIPDNAARMNPARLMAGKEQPLSAHINHPDLVAAYPPLGWIDTLRSEDLLAGGVRGSYRRGEAPAISYGALEHTPGNAALRAAGREQEKSILLHESQHAVQDREGFARGANPESAFGVAEQPILDQIRAQKKAIGIDPYAIQNRIASRYKVSPEDLSKLDEWRNLTAREDEVLANALSPRESYRRFAGEVEARNVQSRMNLTPEERRAKPPWLTQDVPFEQQLVQLRDAGPQLALPGGGGKIIQPQPAARMGDVAAPTGAPLSGEVRGPMTLRPALAGVSELQRRQLGPMVSQLEKLGATPEQLRSFTPKEAYDFIRARNNL